MYRSNAEVWRGLLKNAHDGLGAPGTILPATLVLLLGQVAPFAFLFVRARFIFALGLTSCLCVLGVRLVAARRFRQPLGSVLLHPLAIVALLGIQWCGLLRHLSGRPARWKGRSLGS